MKYPLVRFSVDGVTKTISPGYAVAVARVYFSVEASNALQEMLTSAGYSIDHVDVKDTVPPSTVSSVYQLLHNEAQII